MKSVLAARSGDASQFSSAVRAPIPAVLDAARYLDAAVSAHLARHFDIAQQLILLADTPPLRACARTMREPDRGSMPDLASDAKHRLLLRDRHHCRHCGTPVIAPGTGERIKNIYHRVLRWGKTTEERHAGLQVMTANFILLIAGSASAGGDWENFGVACGPCRAEPCARSVEELCLLDSRARTGAVSGWDGLERFR